MKGEEKRHHTLYRQYRPSVFGEVRGQSHIVETLERAIKHNKIAHAYLFAGGRGTGKTTVARILARELGVHDEDLYEMDAASNRGIDNIRELREGAYAMPFRSPYKCYIIDEAHMLTKEAWNALLKTLEEPPAHCIFVLATTEMQKVPETIQSRCEVYTFKQPTREMLAQMMIDVGMSEGFTIDRPAAELLALLAEGSFRDGLSVLQKVLSTSESKKINAADVETVSGAPRSEIVRDIIRGLEKKDSVMALKAIQQAVSENMDPRTLAKILIHRLRIIILMRYAGDFAQSLSEELTETDRSLAIEVAAGKVVNSDTLRTILEAYAAMAYAAVPHLPLELAVIDLTSKS